MCRLPAAKRAEREKAADDQRIVRIEKRKRKSVFRIIRRKNGSEAENGGI